ncbi:hypothetical protein, partial [Curtobacterium sp. GC_Cur_1]|uniref:hypothetical protein n=1 Tax=Curtobacterium sp. GC_Cur_1 TaxID=2937374 RepID=UPI00226B5DAD
GVSRLRADESGRRSPTIVDRIRHRAIWNLAPGGPRPSAAVLRVRHRIGPIRHGQHTGNVHAFVEPPTPGSRQPAAGSRCAASLG